MCDKIQYICDNWLGLVIALVIGFFLHLFIRVTKERRLTKERRFTIKKLDNVVLYISFIGAVVCLIFGIFNKEDSINVQILGFYTSFIFSWLLTKRSSKEEFKDTQNDIANNTYRHIQDIETAAVVAKNRVAELLNKDKDSVKTGLEGILDNLEIILKGIRTNEEDWKNMMNEESRKKIDDSDDREVGLKQSNLGQITPDQAMELKEALGNGIQDSQESEDAKTN